MNYTLKSASVSPYMQLNMNHQQDLITRRPFSLLLLLLVKWSQSSTVFILKVSLSHPGNLIIRVMMPDHRMNAFHDPLKEQGGIDFLLITSFRR